MEEGTISLAMGSSEKNEMMLKAKVTVASRQKHLCLVLNIKEGRQFFFLLL